MGPNLFHAVTLGLHKRGLCVHSPELRPKEAMTPPRGVCCSHMRGLVEASLQTARARAAVSLVVRQGA